MDHGSSNAAIAEAVCAIIMAKNADHLHSHPNTEIFDYLKKKLAKACAAIRTTAWRVQHGCLPLSLSNSALACATNSMITRINLPLPDKINKAINEGTSAFEQLALKVDQDALWIEWWTRMSCPNVDIEIIVASVGAQYLEELEEEFTG